jgi:GntR family transcriptional regulator
MTSGNAAEMSYKDVAEWLRAKIDAGDLARGAQVPSQAEVARDLGVSVGKARQALDELTRQGLISGGQGRPRFVRDRRVLEHYASRSESMARRKDAPADAWFTDVKEQGYEPGYQRPLHRVEIVEASEDIARLLDLEPGAPVVVRRRVRTVDSRPDNLNDTYYDHRMAETFPEIISPKDVPQGIVALMASRGYEQVRYRHELRWRPPTPDEAAALEIPAGVSVLIQMNTGYTKEGPVKVTVTTWPGDSHVLIYEVDA